jgi:5-methyltetrahydrofolate corrinoid/iron sulfur protein methyltransferase
MLLIGNQIRLMRPPLASAVRQRFDMLIKTLARRQVEGGAGWLLVDIGPQRKNAAEDLAWLVSAIHDEVSIPLVLRSDDPAAMEAGLQAARDEVLIDATLPGVSAPDPFIDLAQRYGARLALAACLEGMPRPTEERLTLVSDILLPQVFDAGLTLDDVYIDPLLTALTCDQPMVPVAVETLQLLKVAAEPAPNTLVHLDDVADGVSAAARPYVMQAYLTMLLAAGIDALAADVLDPELMDVMRVVLNRDPTTSYDRLLLRLFDVTKADVDLDPASVNESDPEQVKLVKTIQILNNQVLYADSYLRA